VNLAAIRVGLVMLLAGQIWVAAFPSNTSTNEKWFTRVWQSDDGLLNNNISTIVQGRDGYLWIVTPVSLMRFDGTRFSAFPVKDFTGSIEPHNIRTIYCSGAGALWIVPNFGEMVGLNPDFSLIQFPKDRLSKGAPWTLAETKDGSMWFGYSGAIFRIKGGSLTRFASRQGMPADGAPLLANDGAGNLWLAKGNQICLFDSKRFRQIARLRDVECLAASHTNAVWLVGHGHLFKCDTGGALEDLGVIHNSAAATVEALLEDQTGAVWIGTDGNGLFRFADSHFERIDTSHSSILSLMEDREGSIWVGTGGGGLDRISMTAVRLEAMERNGVLSQLQSLCQDNDGMLWGATLDRMLAAQINGKWTPVFTNASFAGTVRCVAAAPSGGIWVGTESGKVLTLVNGHCTNCDLGTNSGSGPVSALVPVPSGDLWILHRKVLECLHDGHGRLVIPPPHFAYRFSAIAADVSGNIWLGAKGILVKFDGTNFTDESNLLPISNHTICCLYGAPDGGVWVSCGGLGLLLFKGGRVGQVGADQGLFSNYISQMAADDDGWIWFGSDLGVFKVRQEELEAAMTKRAIRLHPIVYGRNEGQSSLEAIFSTASPYILPLALHSRDGRIWLLMHTGVVVTDPNVLPEKETPPAVLLTQVAMDGKTIASYGDVVPAQTVANLKTLNFPLHLPPGYRHLEFDFTAFHFSDPENIHFRYQLDGFDNGWIDAGTARYATYSRLPAGDYQFRVESCVGDGPWGEKPAQLAFIVAPFFWQTWWFRVGVVVLLSAVLATIVRYISFRQLRLRLRAVEQQAAIERERGRIAQDIHDDLGNRLTKIELLTGLAQLDRHVPEKSVAHIQQISTTARQATDALDEIVWAINPRNDTLPHVVSYLGQFAVEFLRTAGISYRIDLPDFPPPNAVSAEVRHNLFLVVKESLNNIVCHARASEVSVVIAVTDKSISVVIEDNGLGFGEEAQNNGGNGLKNMQQRMSEIGGEFQIKTTPNAGTRVSFSCLCLIQK
jgi:signal transduction histidine kinase/ligand-binding sensor domain-containing protein